MAANNKKMESRTARVEIIGIGDPSTAKGDTKVFTTTHGTYLRTEKPDWAESLVHYFRNDDGGVFGVWGSASLNRGLRTVPPNTYTELEFTGLVTLDNGQKMKAIDVRVPAGTPIRDTADVPF